MARTRCENRIEVGDEYFDGELEGGGGGYATQRFCMDHAPASSPSQTP